MRRKPRCGRASRAFSARRRECDDVTPTLIAAGYSGDVGHHMTLRNYRLARIRLWRATSQVPCTANVFAGNFLDARERSGGCGIEIPGIVAPVVRTYLNLRKIRRSKVPSLIFKNDSRKNANQISTTIAASACRVGPQSRRWLDAHADMARHDVPGGFFISRLRG